MKDEQFHHDLIQMALAEPSQQLLTKLAGVAKGAVGNIQSIDDQINEAQLAHTDVPVSRLPEQLQPLVHSGEYVTWLELSERAANAGWQRLDNLISAAAGSDHSGDSDLLALVSGEASERKTANIIIGQTSADRLPKTKSIIRGLTDAVAQGVLTVADVTQLVTKDQTSKSGLGVPFVVPHHYLNFAAMEEQCSPSAISKIASGGDKPSKLKADSSLLNSWQQAAAAFASVLDEWRKDCSSVNGLSPL